jgi:hypothetical protein
VLVREGSGEVRLVDALIVLHNQVRPASKRPVEMADAQ